MIKKILTILMIFFSSTELFSVEKLSFDAALKEMLSRDTVIPVENEMHNVSKIKAMAAKTAFLPSISLTKTATSMAESGYKEGKTSFIGSMNIFRSGADYSLTKAADYNRDAQLWKKKDQYLLVEVMLMKILLDAIQKKLLMDIAQKLLFVKGQSLQTIRSRYKSGLVASQEVDGVLIDLNNAEAMFKNSEIAFNEARGTLVAKLGHDNIEYRWPWQKAFHEGKHRQMVESELALENRADYRNAELMIKSEEYGVKAAKLSFFPRMDLSYTYDYLDSDARIFSDIGARREQTVYFSITVPLFNNLSDYSLYREKNVSFLAAKYTLENIRREAVSGWIIKRDAFYQIYQTTMQREKTLLLARKLYQDNFKRFQSGRITANDLFVEQNRLLDSERLAVEGWTSTHLAFIELSQALGVRTNLH